MTDQRSLDALDALARHLEIPLSKRELDKVLAAARAAKWAAVEAAGAAAWAASWAAAGAATRATEAAARSAARARQVQIFKGIFG